MSEPAGKRHMSSRARLVRASGFVLVTGLAAAATSGCSGVFDPQTTEADRIAALWWVMLAISVIVGLLVLALLAWALMRPARPSVFETHPRVLGAFIFLGGAAVPFVILVAVFGWSLDISDRSGSPMASDYVIQVTGHQFWYEVHYPAENVTVRDELHIPAGKRTRIEVTSADVIHSLWIPELNGKIDMFPGRTTRIFMSDPSPGTYEARCAEFCGVDHATMRMTVSVDELAAFNQWLSAQPKAETHP